MQIVRRIAFWFILVILLGFLFTYIIPKVTHEFPMLSWILIPIGIIAFIVILIHIINHQKNKISK